MSGYTVPVLFLTTISNTFQVQSTQKAFVRHHCARYYISTRKRQYDTSAIVTNKYDMKGREHTQAQGTTRCACKKLCTELRGETVLSAETCDEFLRDSLQQRTTILKDGDHELTIPPDHYSRRAVAGALAVSFLPIYSSDGKAEDSPRTPLRNLENGLRILVINEGQGDKPEDGAKVEINYIARLAAKQGWQFDNTYSNKDRFGEPIPFKFEVGDPEVIAGLSEAVRLMRVGGTTRVVIPTYLGYQDRTQAPIPREFSNRQRLYSTIFNPTRLANGEGDTLGILIFDIELLAIR